MYLFESYVKKWQHVGCQIYIISLSTGRLEILSKNLESQNKVYIIRMRFAWKLIQIPRTVIFAETASQWASSHPRISQRIPFAPRSHFTHRKVINLKPLALDFGAGPPKISQSALESLIYGSEQDARNITIWTSTRLMSRSKMVYLCNPCTAVELRQVSIIVRWAYNLCVLRYLGTNPNYFNINSAQYYNV